MLRQVLWRTDVALEVRFADWNIGVARPIAAMASQESTS
jgi:hypothetical protein